MSAEKSSGANNLLCYEFDCCAAVNLNLNHYDLIMKKLLLGSVVACFALLPARAGDLTWHTDLAKAQALARAEKKMVLLDFTGSDW